VKETLQSGLLVYFTGIFHTHTRAHARTHACTQLINRSKDETRVRWRVRC